jgi:hypothetical protein
MLSVLALMGGASILVCRHSARARQDAKESADRGNGETPARLPAPSPPGPSRRSKLTGIATEASLEASLTAEFNSTIRAIRDAAAGAKLPPSFHWSQFDQIKHYDGTIPSRGLSPEESALMRSRLLDMSVAYVEASLTPDDLPRFRAKLPSTLSPSSAHPPKTTETERL